MEVAHVKRILSMCAHAVHTEDDCALYLTRKVCEAARPLQHVALDAVVQAAPGGRFGARGPKVR